MEEQPDVPINPNTADLDSLRRLPGVGPALAQRILEGRPYMSMDDLRRVPGLGPVLLERLAPHLSFAEPEAKTEGGEAAQPADSAAGAEARTARSEGGVAPPEKSDEAAGSRAQGMVIQSAKSPPPQYSRAEVLTLVVGSAAASALISIVVTLLVLAGINGTLDVSRHRIVRTMQADFATIKQSLTDLTNEMASAQARLEALEGLTGRMAAIETRVGERDDALADALEELNAMRTTVDTVAEQMEGLATRVDRFSRFLDGLGRVLADLAATPVGEDQLPATPVP